MSCQSVKSQNRSVMKLDFTEDMSIEIETEQGKKDQESPINKNMCKLF